MESPEIIINNLNEEEQEGFHNHMSDVSNRFLIRRDKRKIKRFNPFDFYSEPSKEQMAWLAGIIDGEGCISIIKVKNNKKQKIYYRPYIEISNTNLEILVNCARISNSNTIREDKRQFADWKRRFRLIILPFKKQLEIIEKVLPYLKGKREQAFILKEFLKRRIIKLNKPNEDRIFDDKELELYNKIKILNRRGLSGQRIPTGFTID